ncbi:MAG: RNA polymerase sigma factor [Verrucomicrobiia bacterium]
MGPDASNQDGIARTAAQFATTHWSAVLAAGDGASSAGAVALEALCRVYWYPLYAFARRYGRSPEDAKDLTQGFFALLIERQLTRRADPKAGRFRTFLLHAFTDYLHDCRRREHAAKRGGQYAFVPLDIRALEEYLATDLNDSPELIFDRKWALAVVGEATRLLEAEYHEQGKGRLFADLRSFLQGDEVSSGYVELGRALGLSPGAVKVAVYRMRQRYRELLRAVIAQTVTDPREIDDEVRHLVRVLTV